MFNLVISLKLPAATSHTMTLEQLQLKENENFDRKGNLALCVN